MSAIGVKSQNNKVKTVAEMLKMRKYHIDPSDRESIDEAIKFGVRVFMTTAVFTVALETVKGIKHDCPMAFVSALALAVAFFVVNQ